MRPDIHIRLEYKTARKLLAAEETSGGAGKRLLQQTDASGGRCDLGVLFRVQMSDRRIGRGLMAEIGEGDCGVCIGGRGGDGWEVWLEKMIKARKPHECYEC